jgi:hypothetical protein
MVEISQVVLTEYFWNGSHRAWEASGNLYTMDNLGTNAPPPSDIEKNTKCEWRFRHSGTANLKKKWWRHRRTEVLKMKGFLQFGLKDDSQRLKMEALVTRNSLFQVAITEAGITTFKSPKLETTNPQNNGSKIPTSSSDTEDSYYIITDSSFSVPRGKKYVEYTLTFERVNLT